MLPCVVQRNTKACPKHTHSCHGYARHHQHHVAPTRPRLNGLVAGWWPAPPPHPPPTHAPATPYPDRTRHTQRRMLRFRSCRTMRRGRGGRWVGQGPRGQAPGEGIGVGGPGGGGLRGPGLSAYGVWGGREGRRLVSPVTILWYVSLYVGQVRSGGCRWGDSSPSPARWGLGFGHMCMWLPRSAPSTAQRAARRRRLHHMRTTADAGKKEAWSACAATCSHVLEQAWGCRQQRATPSHM